MVWQAEREDAVADANEHLHPSKIFKIKNPQLKIQNLIRGIGGFDVTGGAEYFAYVLGEVKASRRTSGALAWQAEREDAVAGANEHLHPSKIFKIKNQQL